jgi:hypothetical protein
MVDQMAAADSYQKENEAFRQERRRRAEEGEDA